MILLEEAYNIVMKSAFSTATENVDFNESLGRVLAEDVHSDINMPPFDKAAVDGYACKMADINGELEVIDIIPAGVEPKKVVESGKCSKIMTGAMMPDGADCILMVEHTEETATDRIKYLKDKTKNNVCYIGEDVKTNDIVLKKGTFVKPQHIAVLASVGCSNPLVMKKPIVGVISTGDELVEPYHKPGKSQIRNSNAFQLIAQVTNAGATPKYFGIAEDNEQSTYDTIVKAISECDVIMLTGGVSMGDFDFVPKVLQQAKVELLFDSIAVQPGKPTTFGVHETALCFGLPGNPVSSFTQFDLLVRPLIAKMMETEYKPLPLYMEMGVDYTRRRAQRLSWLPIYINEEGKVIPVSYHGSAHIHSLDMADGFISIAIGETSLKKGEIVKVRQI